MGAVREEQPAVEGASMQSQDDVVSARDVQADGELEGKTARDGPSRFGLRRATQFSAFWLSLVI